MSYKRISFLIFTVLGFTVFCTFPVVSQALQGSEISFEPIKCPEVVNSFMAVDNIWMLVAACLVFFMNAGFAMLEAGLCRKSNTVNILAKNLIVFCVSTFAFLLVGFRLMFGDGGSNVVGELNFFLGQFLPTASDPLAFPEGFKDIKDVWGSRAFSSIFFFQLAFAGTSATIVSGAVAERIRFWAFIVFSFCLVAFIYPLIGYWIWNPSGWLATKLSFYDFAGSTVVHSVGGACALTGVLLIKPRQGKFGFNILDSSFSATEETKDFESSSLGLATLGCFILWLGWFGFNGGSTRFLESVPHVITTTMLAGSFGGLGVALSMPFLAANKLRLSYLINGILAGLVSITASSAYVGLSEACLIGFVGSFVVLMGESILKKAKVDDPVGAIPVHLLCGGWGTVAVGLFSQASCDLLHPDAILEIGRQTQVIYQLLGWMISVTTALLLSTTVWLLIGFILDLLDPQTTNRSLSELKASSLIDAIIIAFDEARRGLRVSLENELKGSDETIVP